MGQRDVSYAYFFSVDYIDDPDSEYDYIPLELDELPWYGKRRFTYAEVLEYIKEWLDSDNPGIEWELVKTLVHLAADMDPNSYLVLNYSE